MTITISDATPLPREKAPRRRKRSTFDTPFGRVFLQAFAVVVFFALWEIGVRIGWVSAFLVGSPAGIFAVAKTMTLSGELFSHTWFTLFEAILGFVIGTILGRCSVLRFGIPCSSLASSSRSLSQ